MEVELRQENSKLKLPIYQNSENYWIEQKKKQINCSRQLICFVRLKLKLLLARKRLLDSADKKAG